MWNLDKINSVLPLVDVFYIQIFSPLKNIMRQSIRGPFRGAIASSALRVWFGVALVGAAQNCHAFGISYEAQDLADVVSGEDLWKFTYHISGFNFQPNQGFSVYFDETLYSNLDPSPIPPNSDWSVITVQPDAILGPGIYDALALSGSPNASLTGVFSVSFRWLSSGVPGSQPFELNQFDDSGNFVGSLGSGDVSVFVPGGGGGGGGTGVPEDGSNAFLLMIGTVALAGLRRVGMGQQSGARH